MAADGLLFILVRDGVICGLCAKFIEGVVNIPCFVADKNDSPINLRHYRFASDLVVGNFFLINNFPRSSITLSTLACINTAQFTLYFHINIITTTLSQ
jgi:hypothetical protein